MQIFVTAYIMYMYVNYGGMIFVVDYLVLEAF